MHGNDIHRRVNAELDVFFSGGDVLFLKPETVKVVDRGECSLVIAKMLVHRDDVHPIRVKSGLEKVQTAENVVSQSDVRSILLVMLGDLDFFPKGEYCGGVICQH